MNTTNKFNEDFLIMMKKSIEISCRTKIYPTVILYQLLDIIGADHDQKEIFIKKAQTYLFTNKESLPFFVKRLEN